MKKSCFRGSFFYGGICQRTKGISAEATIASNSTATSASAITRFIFPLMFSPLPS